MGNLKAVQPLSSKANNELAMRAHNGDQKAKEDLVLLNTKLIWSVVQKYMRSESDKDDLFQEATIGFLVAISSYDIEKGSFSTHATSWMRSMILKYFHKQEGFRIESSFYQKKIKYDRLKENYDLTKLTESQLTEYNLSLKDIQKLESLEKQIYSLDAMMEQESNYEYNFADKDFGTIDSIESIFLKEEQRKIILKAIDMYLTENEKFVILKTYGFDGEPMKMSELAELYMKKFDIESCSRQNIQQIKSIAEKKLRNVMSLKHLI